MTSRTLGLVLLATLLPHPAGAVTLPLVYAGCPVNPADPTRLEIADGVKGVTVLYRRGGADPGPYMTPDVNLARVSRRLFFTLRTSHGLIEFQGHALDDKLDGVLSDESGVSRPIALAAAGKEPLAPCAGLPDSPRRQ